MTQHLEKVIAHARAALEPVCSASASHLEQIAHYKSFLKKEEHRVRLAHKAGAGGLEVCARRSGLLDVVLHNLFDQALRAGAPDARVALVAAGGYGRGFLNPCSDVDLHFFHPGKINPDTHKVIMSVLYMLWDVGFKVGHAVRSLQETYEEANGEPKTKTALIETRFITGEKALFDEFKKNFRKECIDGQEAAFLENRRADLAKRHAQHYNTVLVKEPNVKNGCGALRDYHNIIWICYAKLGIRDIDALVGKKIMSQIAAQELKKGFEFLMRVRNDLHYIDKQATDILTLRSQGLVATNFGYMGRRIIQRTEKFMKDYYQHARNIYQHNLSLMERFELMQEEEEKPSLIGFLARQHQASKHETFDGFYSQNGRIYPDHEEIFSEDSGRLMRLFAHTQVRHLKLSPEIRQLAKENIPKVDKTFQYKKSNREIFETILSRKGDVARTLRDMHRVRFLGRYLPEFGALTDLVQHEFFHRFTADEHTLQTIEKLDELSDSADPKVAFQQSLFHDVEDPFILYLALIMHDTGRAENIRLHTDGSAELTDKVCRRLQVTNKRRRLLMFLVEHHLTFWSVATTRNIEDPAVVSDFARIMKDKESLDMLYVMTYADSKATHEHGWTDWKESLLRQLYHSTVEYFQDQTSFQSRFNVSARDLRKEVEKEFDASYHEEIAAHFAEMPDRYFSFREAASIAGHIRLFRQFYRQLRKNDPAAALTPVMKWSARPQQGSSKLRLVSWDRRLLLAKVAGALAANNINILSADLFLRRDNLVLDIFRVCTTDFEPVQSEKTIASVEKLVARAFSGEVIDFPTLIKRHVDPKKQIASVYEQEFPSRVVVSNFAHRDYTVVDVQAVDRIGLLYAVFQAIGGLGLEITHARINTEKGAAIDSFFVVDARGKKIEDAQLRDALRAAVKAAIS